MILLQALVVGLSIAVGCFVYLKPRLVIDIQIGFYRKINWKIEPVSMEKEVRNTRIMGLSLVLIALFAGIYSIFF